MSVDSSRAQGKVKWRRFAIVAVPAVAIAGILVGLTAEGALASSISVSGQEFTDHCEPADGTGFAQFGGSLPNSKNGQTPVIVSTMKNATLSHLCQSVTVLGLTIRLTAGGGGTPVSATNLVVDADRPDGELGGLQQHQHRPGRGHARRPGGHLRRGCGPGHRSTTWSSTPGTPRQARSPCPASASASAGAADAMTADDAGTAPEAGSRPVPGLHARRRGPPASSAGGPGGAAAPSGAACCCILSGLELFAIPLSGVLVHGAVKLVIYIGIAGVFGVLIGALLVAAGLAIWLNQTHKTFYGVAGIVLGIVSFPASNLGGLFIGMLLAIIGGSIAFAWTPVQPAQDAMPGTATSSDAGEAALS